MNLGSTTLLPTVYTLNAVGNRTAKTQGTTTENYSFDAVDQVTGASYVGGSSSARSVSYDYDSVGNRTSVVDNGQATNYSTNNLNQYTSVGGVAHAHDSNGNLTSGQGIFLYDSMNRLTKATVGSNVVEFTYDSKNRVVKRVTNGTPLFLVYEGWNLIEERNAAGVVEQKYIHGAAIDEILVKVNASGSVYYHQDGLGSVTQLTDSNGNVVEKYSYDIFGKATIFGGSNLQPTAQSLQSNRFLFTGREWIEAVGLYDYRNRVYSCELGRFLQTDPIRFEAGDVNLYRYVDNDGINSTDPGGLSKRSARNADRKGHKGKKNSDKHSNAQGHGGREKPNFTPKPKRNCETTGDKPPETPTEEPEITLTIGGFDTGLPAPDNLDDIKDTGTKIAAGVGLAAAAVATGGASAGVGAAGARAAAAAAF